MAAEKEQALVTQFPLLQSGDEIESDEPASAPADLEAAPDAIPATEEPFPTGGDTSTLDELFGTTSHDEPSPPEELFGTTSHDEPSPPEE